ncbi:hypothetical protein TREES_T100015889 [Tupaia chinensis]|uniref:Uncharacterized protein n=1 Tax=Tupaia chinensis TaxID=246437 RepID=L9L1I3_TUPCH|nr:hypothetical protein TREES_T100015889 [Tupaia chinensis]
MGRRMSGKNNGPAAGLEFGNTNELHFAPRLGAHDKDSVSFDASLQLERCYLLSFRGKVLQEVLVCTCDHKRGILPFRSRQDPMSSAAVTPPVLGQTRAESSHNSRSLLTPVPRHPCHHTTHPTAAPKSRFAPTHRRVSRGSGVCEGRTEEGGDSTARSGHPAVSVRQAVRYSTGTIV